MSTIISINAQMTAGFGIVTIQKHDFIKYDNPMPSLFLNNVDSKFNYYGITAMGEIPVLGYLLRGTTPVKTLEEKSGVYFNDLVGFETGFGNGFDMGVNLCVSLSYLPPNSGIVVTPRVKYSTLFVVLNDSMETHTYDHPIPLALRYGCMMRFKKYGISYDWSKSKEAGDYIHLTSHIGEIFYFYDSDDDYKRAKYFSMQFGYTSSPREQIVGSSSGVQSYSRYVIKISWGFQAIDFGGR